MFISKYTNLVIASLSRLWFWLWVIEFGWVLGWLGLDVGLGSWVLVGLGGVVGWVLVGLGVDELGAVA